MPVTPKYVWKQDKDAIQLQISLSCASLSNADIYVSDLVLKINAPPYLLVLDLYDSVDANAAEVCKQSKCKELWIRLKKFHERKTQSKANDERKTLRAQMDVDESNRQILSDLKAAEKNQEETALYESLRCMRESQSTIIRSEQHPTQQETLVSDSEDEAGTAFHEKEKQLDTEVIIAEEEDTSPECDVVDSEIRIPRVRTPFHSTYHFTSRVFPTPLRESKAVEEQDWLMKHRDHLKKHPTWGQKASYDISEEDPVWLKAKGDDYAKNKDYRGAVNAYTEAISLVQGNDILLTICLANRATCYLHLRCYKECATDCTKALEQVPDNRDIPDERIRLQRLRLKLLTRRGAAYCWLGKFTEAKADYGHALSIDSENHERREDFLQIVAATKAYELKQNGDTHVRNNHTREAMETYSEALKLNPTLVTCLSNRAACYLTLKEPAKCIEDCCKALSLLQTGEDELDETLCFAFIPNPGSSQRKLYVLALLVRRGMAFAMIKDWEKALEDYRKAHIIDPDNKLISGDLAKLETVQLNQKAETCQSEMSTQSP
uniref:Uncharacterized protein AlNc14C11G1387 n=1 Tax=Albugo laibachii Nc14 TaxID=890382 RepID=F0W308_9STRA|nr:conserved hypothetical protein [Albugo laibachii Nc14]|eukprot:CCA15445.1 conserved hypothetical protein [Albugo laibachii Nc14]